MGNENLDAFHTALEQLDIKTLRVEELEKELEEVRTDRDLMKRALNVRQAQAKLQLERTMRAIFRLAGKSDGDDFTDEQRILLGCFEQIVKDVSVMDTWNPKDRNKYTSWDHIW